MVTMIDPKNIQNPCIRRVMALPRRRCCSRSCKLPEELRRSLTWDQGKEMHAHKRFTVATNVQVNSLIRAARAARLKREHQRPAAAVPPERNRFLAHLSELT